MPQRQRSLPRSRRQYVMHSPALELAQEIAGIRYGLKPDFVEPCLATLQNVPPQSENWVHEIKFDGYRAQIHKTDAGTQIFTRRGHDWRDRFLPIVGAIGDIKTHGVIIDGEVIVEIDGRSDFGALQDDLGAGRTDRMIFYAFDLLYLDGVDLRGAALIDFGGAIGRCFRALALQ